MVSIRSTKVKIIRCSYDDSNGHFGINPVAGIQDKIKALKEKYLKDIEDIACEDVDFDEDGLFAGTTDLSHG